MQKFILITATFGVPLLLFMTLSDAVSTFYAPDEPARLAYQVVEIEDEPEVEEEPEAEAEPEVEAAIEPEVEEVAAAEAAEPEVAEAEVAEAEVAQADDAVADEVTEEAAVEPDASEAEAGTVEVAALSEEDLAAAARAMRGCKACHQWERERNGAGPHLVGVVGRPIGAVDGFRYSKALQALNEAGDVWSVEALEVWLEDPDEFAEGTKMNYKVRDADDRRLIAAWLAANG